MLVAATQGAIPSEGPTNKILKPGNAEYVNSIEYEEEQLNQLCGRFFRKIDMLNAQQPQHWALTGRAG